MSAQASTVLLENLILENDSLRVARILSSVQHGTQVPRAKLASAVIPAEATRCGVGGAIYDGNRMGSISLCTDAVILQRRDGRLQVPLILRATPPFGGCWWIMGGAQFNYRSMHHFLIYKIFRECGMTTASIEEFVAAQRLADDEYSCQGVHIIDCLGMARTPAPDMAGTGKVCDTGNLCYLALLEEGVELSHDGDHRSIRWFDEAELADENACGHWYPRWAALKALEIARIASTFIPLRMPS